MELRPSAAKPRRRGSACSGEPWFGFVLAKHVAPSQPRQSERGFGFVLPKCPPSSVQADRGQGGILQRNRDIGTLAGLDALSAARPASSAATSGPPRISS